MTSNERRDRFTAKLICAVQDCLSNEENENYIELKEEEATDFFHSLANVMPTYIYSNLSGDKKNLLEFNHIANSLCFQYLKADSDE